jgi:hypothetical protein
VIWPNRYSNWFFSTGTYNVSEILIEEMFQVLNETISVFDIPGGIEWSVAFEPMPTAITRLGELKGGNVLGIEPEDGNAFGTCHFMIPIPFRLGHGV